MINCLLMDLSSDQDRFTFRILYERTINRFLAIAKSILRNQEDAEEFVHDVYTSWMKDYTTYRHKTINEMTALGIVTVRNRSINLKNRKEKYMETPSDDIEMCFTDHHNDNDVIDYIVKAEKMEALKDAIKGLSADEQMLLMLKYELEMSYREISKTMKIKENTVKIKLTRIKKKLYQTLKNMDS